MKYISFFIFAFIIILSGKPVFSDAFLWPDSTSIQNLDKPQKIKRLVKLSEESISTNDSLALAFANEALIISKSLQDDDFILESYHQLLLTLYYIKDYKSAKEMILNAENTVIQNNSINNKAKYFLICGQVYSKLSEYNLAEYYLTKSLQAYQQSQEQDSLQTIFLALAHNYKAQHEFDEAAKNANQALQFAKSKKDDVQMALSKRILGEIYAEQQNLEISLEYFTQNLKYFQEIKDSIEIGRSLNNIALTYFFMAEYESSINYTQQSMAIRKQSANTEELAENYNNLALPYIKLGNWEEALYYMNKSLKLFEDKNDLENIPIVLINIGDLKLKQGLINEAMLYYNKAYDSGKQNNRLVANSRYHKSFYQLYSHQDNFTKALHHYKLFIAYKDSIDYNEQQQYLSELNIKYQTERKEKQLKLNKQEIALLQTGQELKDIRLSNQKTWLNILSAGIMMTVLFLFLVFLQMHRKNIAYKILAKKNLEIASSERLPTKQMKEHTPPLSKEEIESNFTSQNPRYSESQLSLDQRKALLKQVLDIMEKDKPYLDKTFTLEVLSKTVDTSRSYISQAINEELSLNFRNFINQYRIKEARQMLSDPANKNLTIESIAYSVGFGSKSAFNIAFKNYTGITPSFYLKSLGENTF